MGNSSAKNNSNVKSTSSNNTTNDIPTMISKDSVNTSICSLFPKKPSSPICPIEFAVQDEIWYFDNFLSAKQCNGIIEFTEKLGYGKALLNAGYGRQVLDTSIRDCSRVMIDDLETAAILAEQLYNYAPLCQEGALYHSMNERLRVLKYSKDQKFALHMDGLYQASQSVKSILTIQFYLNTVSKGGATRFEWKGWDSGEFSCAAKQGRAVIFRQDGWWHEGCPIGEGLKYTVRTDLMYKTYTKAEWEEKVASGELKNCAICEETVKAEELKCGHMFLSCGCSPYYSGDKKIGKKKIYQRNCGGCYAPIRNVSKELQDLI